MPENGRRDLIRRLKVKVVMISLFCDTTRPQWVIDSRRFETKKCLRLQGSLGLTRDISGLGPIRILKKGTQMLKHWEPITHWGGVVSHENGIFSYTAAKASKLAKKILWFLGEKTLKIRPLMLLVWKSPWSRKTQNSSVARTRDETVQRILRRWFLVGYEENTNGCFWNEKVN